MKILLLIVLFAGAGPNVTYYPATLPHVDPAGNQLPRTLDDALTHGNAAESAVDECVAAAQQAEKSPDVKRAFCTWIYPQPQPIAN